MTSEQKDRFIAEKLGVEWHDIKKEGRIFRCICGAEMSKLASYIHLENPDFTSEAGRVKLLKLIYKLDINEWLNFINLHDVFWLLTDDTGKFRDAVYKWLGGEE